MAPSKIRKALGAVKDQTSISLAKVSNSATLADLEVAIVKATRHDEYPAEEKHVREILSLTSYSRTSIVACVALLSRRLGKTRSWAVALKALVLIHRLLADGDPAYEREVFFGTRRGTRMLNMSEFRDAGGRAEGWDYSAFVRTYARYIDERLEYKMLGRRYRRGNANMGGWRVGEEGAGSGRSTPAREMKTDRMLVKAHHLQMLLDRFLACRPTGAAKESRIVAMALYPLIKESFPIYSDLTQLTSAFVDRFTNLLHSDCIRVHELFSKLSKQFEDLDSFYSWSRSAGIARPSDYPQIEHITKNHLKVMEDFVRDRSLLSDSQISPLDSAGIDKDGTFGVGLEDKLADFIHLREDESTNKHNNDTLALALVDNLTPNSSSSQPWEPFKETSDWEKTLVESANNFPSKNPDLAIGFDMLTLPGMYSQTTTAITTTTTAAAAPTEQLLCDPFAPSAAVAAPPWVEMSDMETKQKLFVEEQLMWQQYARDGMQGKLPLKGVGQYPYNWGGYTQRF